MKVRSIHAALPLPVSNGPYRGVERSFLYDEFIDSNEEIPPFLSGITDERARENVIAAACEGYAFPTNLDNDPPVGGLAPPSQADLVRRAVAEGWTIEQVRLGLAVRKARRAGLTP